jgi:hypothetical protein
MSKSRSGPPAAAGAAPDGSLSAYGLLDVDCAGRAVDIYLPPGLLDDLHDPNLIITPGYVGPERRDPAQRHRSYRSRRGPRRPGRGLRLIETAAVVLATVVAAVPLTLIASHSMVGASAAPAPNDHTAETASAIRGSPAAARQPRSARLGLRHLRSAANRPKVATDGPAIVGQTPSTSCGVPRKLVRTARCAARLARTQRQEARASLRAARTTLRATRAAQRASRH